MVGDSNSITKCGMVIAISNSITERGMVLGNSITECDMVLTTVIQSVA